MSRAEIFLQHIVQTGLRRQWFREDGLTDATVWTAMRGTTEEVADDGLLSLPCDIHDAGMRTVLESQNCRIIVHLDNRSIEQLVSHLMPYQTSLELDADTFVLIRGTASEISAEDLTSTDTVLLLEDCSLLIWSKRPAAMLSLVEKRQRQVLVLLHDAARRKAAVAAHVEKRDTTEVVVVEIEEDVEARGSAAVVIDAAAERPVRWIWPAVVATTFCLIGASWGVVLSNLLPIVLSDSSPGHAIYLLYLPFSGFLSSVRRSDCYSVTVTITDKSSSSCPSSSSVASRSSGPSLTCGRTAARTLAGNLTCVFGQATFRTSPYSALSIVRTWRRCSIRLSSQ